MTAWLRFRRDGETGFGTLTGDGIAVHDGAMFGAARPNGRRLALDDVEASVRTATLVREQFPQLRILARARNRQLAFALMDAGVSEVIRETYASSLEIAAGVLKVLGETPANASEAVRRFREHDQKTLQAQYAVKDDEEKFLATSIAAAKQLERLFEADQADSDSTAPHG